MQAAANAGTQRLTTAWPPAQGVPLYREVFEGNTAEVNTLQGSIKKVMERFPV
jgi:hypothetical protein